MNGMRINWHAGTFFDNRDNVAFRHKTAVLCKNFSKQKLRSPKNVLHGSEFLLRVCFNLAHAFASNSILFANAFERLFLVFFNAKTAYDNIARSGVESL